MSKNNVCQKTYQLLNITFNSCSLNMTVQPSDLYFIAEN